MIKEEIKLIRETKKDLRKFGLTVGSVLLGIGLLFIYLQKGSSVYFVVAGLILILAGMIYPAVLRSLNRIWMMLAILMGWVMTRVILVILFYLVVTPTGLLARIFRKDFLKLEYDKTAESYWEKRDRRTPDPAEYERQF